jgi:tripartite-type tricarboxylate transporter receptor subunit TctC
MGITPMRIRRASPFVGFVAALAVTPAQAENWPERPVRVVVPLAPGGSVDIVARSVASRLAVEFGQQFVVDNRTGAGGTIGAAIVARAAPDGYTLIVMSSGYAASAALYKLPYDSIKDIAPIAMIAAGPMFLTLHPSVKATRLKEFIELARTKPVSLNYGSGGTGSSTHLATELFQQMAKTDMTHIPYKGIGAAIADLLGGQIQVYFAPGPAVFPHVATEKLRIIAVTSEQRSPAQPDLPAIGELVPGYSATFWYGMGAPTGTPQEIVARLNQALAGILRQPSVQERLRADGLEPAHSTPEAFARLIARDIAMWSKVVKVGKIKVD